jgi:hypothetical protein
MADIVVRTSETGWFTKLAEAYKNRIDVTLVDNARVGIDPKNESLVQMGLKAKLTPTEWTAVGVAIGMSAAGIAMVVLAFLDPEPTSKLGLLVGGGIVCVASGGFSAIHILTKVRPPDISLSLNGIEIRWQK